jgi:glutathione peroxidase-family protein
MAGFHDFTVQTIGGEDFDLSQLAGSLSLVVNVASR